MDNQKLYYVYMHRNKINDKKYIGITCRKKPKHRWGKNGNSYKGQVFKIAIDKYGWDNFEHLILYKNLCAKDAYLKEQELIKRYKTNEKEYGYNLSIGGEHGSTGYLNNSMSIIVYQYDLNGIFICEYPSLSEAERVTGISNSSISSCCKGKQLYTGEFQWSYEKVDKMPIIDKHKLISEKTRKKARNIYCYDINGFFIKKYKSARIASKETNTGQTKINSCCSGRIRYSNNFQWFYEYMGEKIEPINKYENLYHKTVKVNQYDKNGNFIKTWNTIKEASNAMGSHSSSNILRCLSGEGKTAYGYIWEYAS